MSRSDALQPLLPPLASIQRLLARFNERGMVIGGVAASLLGRPRLTADVDVVLLLSVADLPHLMKAAAEECLLPRIRGCGGLRPTPPSAAPPARDERGRCGRFLRHSAI